MMLNDIQNILIAEDAPTQAEHLKSILEEQHYQVSVARNGEEAFNLMPTLNPDIVISDIMMPKLNGYQLCQKIKADSNFKNTPVILLTTLTDVADVIKGLESGADHFLTKPFEKKYLLERVNRVLASRNLSEDQNSQEAVDIEFSGRSYSIKADRLQILSILLDTAVQRNNDLLQIKDKLQVANKKLEQSVCESNTLNEELESFSSSVSHDLRAPLRAIMGYAHILLKGFEGKLDEKEKGYLLAINSAAEHMRQLIEDLLRLSKLGGQELRSDHVDLTKMALEIIDDLRRSEPKRNIKVSIAENLTLEGDVFLFRVVLDNLLRNAWKFTSKKSEAVVEFGMTYRERVPTYYIRDNGAGFDMKYSEKLFTPFGRMHPSSEFEGTGIGLATVQRIIHRHHGKIWVEAKVEKGTTFYFQIRQL
ncbi:MAG: response regulator [Bdellovibrionia bacterium]